MQNTLVWKVAILTNYDYLINDLFHVYHLLLYGYIYSKLQFIIHFDTITFCQHKKQLHTFSAKSTKSLMNSQFLFLFIKNIRCSETNLFFSALYLVAFLRNMWSVTQIPLIQPLTRKTEFHSGCLLSVFLPITLSKVTTDSKKDFTQMYYIWLQASASK